MKGKDFIQIAGRFVTIDEAGWLSVANIAGKPHVELMWAVGGVRVIEEAEVKPQSIGFQLKLSKSGYHLCFESGGHTLSGSDNFGPTITTGAGEIPEFAGIRMPPLPPKPDLSDVKFGSSTGSL